MYKYSITPYKIKLEICGAFMCIYRGIFNVKAGLHFLTHLIA